MDIRDRIKNSTNIQELKDIIKEASAEAAYARIYTAGSFDRSHKTKSLYFVACGDTVKVGVSNYPEVRMEALQTGASGKLTLVASIPNAGHRENECHKKLAHLRLYGEWFWYTEEVNALIKELQA